MFVALEEHRASMPRLIAAQARRQDVVSIEALCQEVLLEWPILSAPVRRELVKRAEGVLRPLAAALRDQFRFEPATTSLSSRVVILNTPARLRPQGRTQGWQAEQRRISRLLGRRAEREESGQLSLDDLAQEGGLADE